VSRSQGSDDRHKRTGWPQQPEGSWLPADIQNVFASFIEKTDTKGYQKSHKQYDPLIPEKSLDGVNEKDQAVYTR
jgi:hypothetical protein